MDTHRGGRAAALFGGIENHTELQIPGRVGLDSRRRAGDSAAGNKSGSGRQQASSNEFWKAHSIV
jgi:hypothetical protein